MRFGTTAFSFTNEWLTGSYTLEQLLERVAGLGLGPAIELDGYQTWRDYPRLEDSEVLAFRRLADRLRLEPAALGAYVDLLRRPGRPLTTAEAVAALVAQIELARRLGFPLLKLHAGIPVEVLEQALHAAERSGVTLATEAQGGQTPDDPAIAAVLECRERTGSPHIALTLDFSVGMTAVPASFVDALCRAGMRRGDADRIVVLWLDGASIPELFAALAATGAPEVAVGEARGGLFRFGRQEPRAWAPHVPATAHAHAKFWELDAAGDEPTTRNAELLSVLRDGGYQGVVCSEWGGNAWAEADEVDAFELVRRHLKLLRSLVSRPAAVPVSS